MTWVQRLKRVFKIDIETCNHYGGTVLKIIGKADIKNASFLKRRRSGHGRLLTSMRLLRAPPVQFDAPPIKTAGPERPAQRIEVFA
jgi:hypothetical protein